MNECELCSVEAVEAVELPMDDLEMSDMEMDAEFNGNVADSGQGTATASRKRAPRSSAKPAARSRRPPTSSRPQSQTLETRRQRSKAGSSSAQSPASLRGPIGSGGGSSSRMASLAG